MPDPTLPLPTRPAPTGSRIAAALMLGAAAALGGCAMMAAPMGTISREDAVRSNDWHKVATESDRLRIRDWWSTFEAALASARSHGHAREVAAEGALLEPAAALTNPHIPAGDYDCRVIKLGTPAGSSLAFVAYPRFRCRIEAEQDIFSFTKLSGSQRPSGLLFDDTDHRKIFLGTLAMGDETRALDYGADRDRNSAGILERIGPTRWRLLLPRPAFESIMDVIELEPVSE